MDRRHFLKTAGLVAGAIYVDLPAFAEKASDLGPAKLKIGILSDIHVRNEETSHTFRKALEYFRDQEVDGVMIAGDMADDGLERQMKVIADTWFSVFPKDKLPNGKHVERLFVYGNHDVEAHTYHDYRNLGISDEDAQKEAIGPRREKLWKKYYHENYVPVYMKVVNGYRFIGSQWFSWDENPHGVQFLKDHAAELHDGKPFFYFQHAHPKNTCMGEWAWGQENGEVTKALSEFPNAIAFSGHSHHTLTDDRDIWYDGFTSIGTASLSYLYPLGGRENSSLDGDNRHLPFEMEAMGCRDGKQGLLMTLYDSHIALERREFVYDEKVGDDWIIPVPLKPMSFDDRAKTAPVPEFQEGAKVTLTEQDGKDRWDEEHRQVVVHFPSVLRKNAGVRAFDYEICVEQRYVDVITTVATKRVYSAHCYLGENKDEEEVICLFNKATLPEFTEYRFAIRPCNCFGGKGEAICSEWQNKG